MRTVNRLARMLRRLHIDVASGFDMNMAIISKAVILCETCSRTDACDIWLDSGKQDGGYRAICPNAAPLDCLPRSEIDRLTDKVA